MQYSCAITGSPATSVDRIKNVKNALSLIQFNAQKNILYRMAIAVGGVIKLGVFWFTTAGSSLPLSHHCSLVT